MIIRTRTLIIIGISVNATMVYTVKIYSRSATCFLESLKLTQTGRTQPAKKIEVLFLFLWIANSSIIHSASPLLQTPPSVYRRHCWWIRVGVPMNTSSNGTIVRVTGPLWGESTGHRWTPFTKASDVEFWCFLWSVPEQTVEQTIETPVLPYRHDTISWEK